MSPSGKAPESPTQVFVTVKDKKLSNDRLFLNVDAVALKDGRVVPHQKVFFEINGERKAVDLPATGVLKEYDLVFKGVNEVRVMLNAWAAGSEFIKTEQEIVVKNEETETEEEQEEPFTRKRNERVLDMVERRFGGVRHDRWREFAEIRHAIKEAGENTLNSLYLMEKHGHEVAVTRKERDYIKGFLFYSSSSKSPEGIRDIDYDEAERIATEWGIELMTKEFWKDFLNLGDTSGTWDHVKTDQKTLESGESFYAYTSDDERNRDRWFRRSDNSDWYHGVNSHGTWQCFTHDKNYHNPAGGFRGMLWIPQADEY